MRDHVHTGFVAFAFAGLSAIVMLHVLRMLAAEMAQHPATAGASKPLAAFALAD